MNVTTDFTLYYEFLSETAEIRFTFQMTNNVGWIMLGYPSPLSNSDGLRVYINSETAAVDDLWTSDISGGQPEKDGSGNFD